MDFQCLAPLSLSLVGDLSRVLNQGQTVETSQTIVGDALLQVTRFTCSSADFASLVQVEIESQGQFRFAFNPFSQKDELRLKRFMPGGALLFVRVKPGNVNITALPDLTGNDFRVDLLG